LYCSYPDEYSNHQPAIHKKKKQREAQHEKAQKETAVGAGVVNTPTNFLELPQSVKKKNDTK
jgi:hypothetical protein